MHRVNSREHPDEFINELTIHLRRTLKQAAIRFGIFFRIVNTDDNDHRATMRALKRWLHFAGFEIAEAREVTFVQRKCCVLHGVRKSRFFEHCFKLRGAHWCRRGRATELRVGSEIHRERCGKRDSESERSEWAKEVVFHGGA